ncbi:MAG: BatA and WFA domain-containing protein [archaeon]
MLQLGNNTGLYGFLALIALIILYLMKRKPVVKPIPSLMFLSKQLGRRRRSFFINRLIRNLLFLLQFLALAALAFSLASPVAYYYRNASMENLVIVIDASASTKTDTGDGTRFDREIDTAKGMISGGKISIVLAQNRPVTYLEQDRSKTALEVLSSVQATDTETNLANAILQAKEIIGKETGKVVVISDFLHTTGPEPMIAKRTLESSNLAVDFIRVGGRARNVGIVDMILNEDRTEVFIKNYNDDTETITVTQRGDSLINSTSVKIEPSSIERVVFGTKTGTSIIEIGADDDFDADNRVYVSVPEKRMTRVLLVANKPIDQYLPPALESIKDLELTIAQPPIIPAIDHDIIIIDKVQSQLILPGTFEDISKEVEKGSNLIVMPQEDLASMNFLDLLPVELTGIAGARTEIEQKIAESFTKDVIFPPAGDYFTAKAKNDTVVIAEAQDGSPVLAYRKIGQGTVFYYGIFDDLSQFHYEPDYPLFWNGLIRHLVEREKLENYNFEVGSIVSVDHAKKPSGRVVSSTLYMDEAGFYELPGSVLAANLLNELESDIGGEGFESTISENIISKKVPSEETLNLEMIVIICAALLLLTEVLLMKYRGDI